MSNIIMYIVYNDDFYNLGYRSYLMVVSTNKTVNEFNILSKRYICPKPGSDCRGISVLNDLML